MAVGRVKVWDTGELLTASDMNAEFQNLIDQQQALGWPATVVKQMRSQQLQLDGDDDSALYSPSDDVAALKLNGVDLFSFLANFANPVNGVNFKSSAVGVSPSIELHGADANIGLDIMTKGTGIVTLNGSFVGPVEYVDASLPDTQTAPPVNFLNLHNDFFAYEIYWYVDGDSGQGADRETLMRFSNDNGVTFRDQSNDYRSTTVENGGAIDQNASRSEIVICPVGVANNWAVGASLILLPMKAGLSTTVYTRYIRMSDAGLLRTGYASGRVSTTEANNAFQLTGIADGFEWLLLGLRRART